MTVESVQVLVEGGKATAAPPLGPQLGPLGVNIGKVVADINTKTQSFKGMQVPVTVSVTRETKEYTISVGTPPASALIKKEAGVEKGSGKPHIDHIADLMIEQIIKIAKMKEDNCAGKTLKDRVKEIIGTCNSMGIMVEGKHAREAIQMVDEGKYAELEKKAQAILKEFEGKERKIIVEQMRLAGIPEDHIKKLLPATAGAGATPAGEEAKGGSAPTAAKK